MLNHILVNSTYRQESNKMGDIAALIDNLIKCETNSEVEREMAEQIRQLIKVN